MIASVAPTLVSQSVSQSDNQSVSQSLTLSDFHSFGVSGPSGSVPRPQSVIYFLKCTMKTFSPVKTYLPPTQHLSTALDWGVVPETCYLWDIQSVWWGDMTFFPEDIFKRCIFLSVLFQCNFWKSMWLSSLPKLCKFISFYTFASIHITYSMFSLCTGYRSLADRIEKKSNLVKREIFICQIRLPLRQIYWREPQHLFLHIPHIFHQHRQRCWSNFSYSAYFVLLLHSEHEKSV